VLCGENGSGKSTLLNTLAGLIKPLSGKITLNISGTHVKPHSHMMYVFQHPDSHFFFDTVAQELTQLGVTDIEFTLAQFGLEGCAERSPHQLSEGQKRRLTLLFPILLGKSLIVLDEPTFGQDALNAERITQLIQSFKSAGYALIVITHDPVLHEAIADQTWRIMDKRLHIEVTPI
jgi:energy-coupling factor transport system ATP-binding protein